MNGDGLKYWLQLKTQGAAARRWQEMHNASACRNSTLFIAQWLGDAALDSVSPSPARRVRGTIVAAGMEELFQPTDFEPDFDDVNVFMDGIEVLHDGAKPGSLTDHGKIAGLVKYQ